MRLFHILAVTLALASSAWSLEPKEVFVVYNKAIPESEKLARYYAQVRSIPADNLIGITTTGNERIARDEYVKTVIEPVKKALTADPERLARAKCLLTIRGVPLKIDAATLPAELAAALAIDPKLQKARTALDASKKQLTDATAKGDTKPEDLAQLQKKVADDEAALKQLTAARESAEKSLVENTRNTTAALDSELQLLLWPDYPLVRWGSNPLRTVLVPPHPPSQFKTFMTARIDGETYAVAKALIDHALEAESLGPKGTAYFDARGFAPGPGAYAPYDEAIRQAAAMVKAHGIPTVLNNAGEVFGPGACPNAVLYCGWYSLANYVDSFQWMPGAVGFHVASSEAVSLRTGNFWCKKMIDKGVTATLGPVEEPFLGAFPDPRAFFGLLLTGKYTLAEVFAETNPWISWRMTLIGDPLYNPYKKTPKMTVDEVKAVVQQPLDRAVPEVKPVPVPKPAK